jgi:hypothetical protein
MKHRLVAALVCVLLAGSGLAVRAQSALDDSERGTPVKEKCAQVHTQAPYRAYGYDHEVVIENTCPKPINCSVKTDVNPEIATVRVAAHATETVVTYRGSPAREFKADVDCKTAP